MIPETQTYYMEKTRSPLHNPLLTEPHGFLTSIPDFDFGIATATAALRLKEPDGFLDSISPYDLSIVTQPSTATAGTATNSTAGSAAMGVSTTEEPPVASNAPWSFFECGSNCWWQCLCHRSCWRWGRRHRLRSQGTTLLVSARTSYAARLYSRVFSNVQSVGSSVYSSLRTLHSLAAISSHGSSNPQTAKKKPSAVDIYESKLRRTRWAARIVGSFYNLATFLSLCSLTWASVVLLGAFVSYLRFVDYAMVTSLLLLEAIRLASAAFFTILLTHGLARRSQDPENIIHGRDDHYRRALAARIVSSILQAILVLPSFICPIIRFPNIQYEERNLHLSLLIFYIFIITNATVSSVTLICSSASFIFLRDRNDQSILRYYDELLQRAIGFGVIRADEFEFFQFAYKMLGREYARIVQPEAVVKNHRKLIEYLYRHRLGQDFLPIFMDEGDAFVQQAAVNMAGFWADPSKKVGLEEVKLAQKVLSKMAEKVGAGQVGWAATNSFGGVARRYPHILAQTKTRDGTPLQDRLAELVDGKSSGSLIYVRTLALFYHYSYEKGQVVPILQQEKELVGKLRNLLKETRVHRARLYAAYLLYLMGHLDERCYDAVFSIQPTTDRYWFGVEMDLLRFIRGKCRDTNDVVTVPKGFVREDDNICPKGIRYL
ncbi:hypothetical protein GOP47_0010846 [Adiantum capillus-veneris]|uniref:Uncharacterized protein n=1 Tax=Adiantum capillus-veneris TaxID=13818 RepID=A0A9D4UW26_ADICA|nr:hypothetical protein GOP47_0010846 [Adiantum capillus-veneris]